MNGVLGLSETLLYGEELSDTQRELLADVQVSGQSLLRLINEILDFTKIATKVTCVRVR